MAGCHGVQFGPRMLFVVVALALVAGPHRPAHAQNVPAPAGAPAEEPEPAPEAPPEDPEPEADASPAPAPTTAAPSTSTAATGTSSAPAWAASVAEEQPASVASTSHSTGGTSVAPLSTVRPPPLPGAPTFTTTTTTTTPTPPILLPRDVDASTLRHGLPVDRFYSKEGHSTVIVIDRQVNHFSMYSPSRLILKWQGFVQIKSAGLYRFQVSAMGFSELQLNDVSFLRSQAQGNVNVTNTTLPLNMESGFHSLVLLYSEKIGQAGVIFEYDGPDSGDGMMVVPTGVLWHTIGPCVLNGIRNIESPPCEGPRWALEDGQSCAVTCKPGFFASGIVNDTKYAVGCAAGVLTSPNGPCEEPRCEAPALGNMSASGGCEEGSTVRSGGVCTPACKAGFIAHPAGVLQCFNGTLQGAFECHPKDSCAPPGIPTMHAAVHPCAGDAKRILHTRQCVAQCAEGYRATQNLTCHNGVLTPESFECLAATGHPLPKAAHSAPSVAKHEEEHVIVPVRSFTTTPPPASGFSWSAWMPLVACVVLCGGGGAVLCFSGGGEEKLWKPFADDGDSEDSYGYSSEQDDARPGRRPSRHLTEASDSDSGEDEPGRGAQASQSPEPLPYDDRHFAGPRGDGRRAEQEQFLTVPPERGAAGGRETARRSESFTSRDGPVASAGRGQQGHQALFQAMQPRGFGHGHVQRALLEEASDEGRSFQQEDQEAAALPTAPGAALGQLGQGLLGQPQERILGSAWQPVDAALAARQATAPGFPAPAWDDPLSLGAQLQRSQTPTWGDPQSMRTPQTSARPVQAPWSDVRVND